MSEHLSDADLKRLNQLAGLRDTGVLTEEEFQVEKVALLRRAAAGMSPFKSAAMAAGGVLLLLILLRMCTTTPSISAEGIVREKSDSSTPASSAAGSSVTAASLGRCNMGSCSWSQTLESKKIQQSKAGVLIQLTLLGGTSDHDGGEYPDRPDEAKIVWNTSPHDVWVFCSAVLPTTIIKSQEGYQADVLRFKTDDGVGGIPGVLESSASLYMNACYSDVPNRGIEPPDLERYRPLPADIEVSIARPEDIIREAERMMNNEAAPSLERVTVGEDYETTRRKLVSGGFTPARFPKDSKSCAGEQVCQRYPEFLDCSGRGANECRFAYVSSDGSFIVGRTVGEGSIGLDAIGWANAQDSKRISNLLEGRPEL